MGTPWTTPATLKAQTRKLWDRGRLLSSLAGVEMVFPCRLHLKCPCHKELSEKFSDVRHWISQLKEGEGYYRIEWRRVNHRIIGTNNMPVAVWLDSREDAFAFIGQGKAAKQFTEMVAQTNRDCPELLPWLARRPIKALELVDDWPKILAIVKWMHRNPRPGIYLRQIDLPGVHSKLIETRKGVLAELFDLSLPEETIDRSITGASGFCCRYGFLDKPLRVRFRLLDENTEFFQKRAPLVDGDIAVTQEDFSRLNIPVSTVFITENEINFLAFPRVPDAMVLFGAGYGFEAIATANWLCSRNIHYWGDVDTHGFAILSQLRESFPNVVSFLMDIHTFLEHKHLWGEESHPELGNLSNLTQEETAFLRQLQNKHWGNYVRLEQERIGFDCLQMALKNL